MAFIGERKGEGTDPRWVSGLLWKIVIPVEMEKHMYAIEPINIGVSLFFKAISGKLRKRNGDKRRSGCSRSGIITSKWEGRSVWQEVEEVVENVARMVKRQGPREGGTEVLLRLRGSESGRCRREESSFHRGEFYTLASSGWTHWVLMESNLMQEMTGSVGKRLMLIKIPKRTRSWVIP